VGSGAGLRLSGPLRQARGASTMHDHRASPAEGGSRHDHAHPAHSHGAPSHGAHSHGAHSHGAHSHGAHGAGGHAGGDQRRVLIAACLTGGFMLAEAVGGILTGSLALLADAGHMLTDAVALILAWYAFRLAGRRATARLTYGFDRVK